MDKIRNLLSELGYNENEIAVYTALLQIGKATVLEISKKAKVKRANTYNILKDLVLKGLVNSMQDQKSIKFFAAHPKKILTSLENKLEYTKEMMPEILKLYKEDEDSPVVQVENSKEFYEYTGVMVRDAVMKGEEILVFGCVNFFLKESPESSEPWFKLMKNSKHKVKILIYVDKNNTDDWHIVKEYIARCHATNNPNLENRVITDMDFPIKTETAIFQNYVIQFTGGKKYNSIVVESPNMANTFKQVFTQIWADGEIL